MRVGGSVVRGLVAAVVVGGTVVVPAHASLAPGPRAQGWVVSRTGRAPAALLGTLHMNAGGSGATVLMFALDGHGAARRPHGAFTTTRIAWGGDAWVSLYGQGVATPECVSLTCRDPARTPFTMRFHTNRKAVTAVAYIATWDAATSVTIESPGWQVEPWRPDMRVVRTDQGGGRGVRVLHTTYGTFRSAEAPGGAYGSLAWAALPCSEGGTGRGTFSGAGRTFEMDCASVTSIPDAVPRRTLWRLAGETDGMDASVNALVVVDYPKE